ncbi:MAG TPA: hypothetical protein VKV25_04210 [Acidimicrobiales bacterium]|nr:hypothetical protein [Acidimicrobiales bacterium]
MRAVLFGFGAVGRRVANELLTGDGVESLVVLHRDPSRVRRLTEGLGARVSLRSPDLELPAGTDVVVIAAPDVAAGVAAAAVHAGAHVIAATAEVSDVRALRALDGAARDQRRTIAVGTTMAPGLSCVLAVWAARHLDRVEQVHVAAFGTGGPACARRHHASLSAPSIDWYDGAWRRRPGGSGRELVWFPEPVGGADCYRARLADPPLLVPAFPGVQRVTSRMAATRRDRLTAPLPMLRPPHPEGTVGATRVELRGWKDGEAVAPVVGGVGRPAIIAATVTAVAARWAVTGRLARPGAAGLAELVGDPAGFLREVAGRGIALSEFAGAAAA